MALDVTVDADLELTFELPGARPVTGSLTGSGTALELRVSDPFLFAGRSDAGAIRGVADGLARRGLTLTVVAPTGPLVTLGAPRTSWLQRRVTGSRHIRVERGAGLWSLCAAGCRPPRAARCRRGTWPRRPQCSRWHRRSCGGRAPLPPRMIRPAAGTPDSSWLPATTRGRETARRCSGCAARTTTIGSDPGCDIVLEGLAPRARPGCCTTRTTSWSWSAPRAVPRSPG